MAAAGEALFARVVAVVGAIFGVDAASVTPDTSSADVAGWDSLSYTMLLLQLEDEFSIEISPAKALELHNVGELAALIAAELRQ